MNTLLTKWRELLGQFEVVRTYYAKLTERERYIVLGAVAGGTLFIMFVIYGSLLAATASMKNKLESDRETLRALDKMKTTYFETERQVKNLDALIARASPDFQLATRISELAKQDNINIETIKPPQTTDNRLYRETQFAVTLRSVNIRTLIDFLYRIENSPQELMRVSSLKIRPSYQDPTQLAVDFTVSTFQPSQGS